jgi:glycosyltransferase involved in cell wall biosynthesis
MCKLLKERERDFMYFIIGEGEERLTLQKYIRENKLENNVFLLGAIPDKTSGATLIRAFDIFILPSTKEGLPYVLLEAGLARVASVSTNVGGIPEIIEHEKSGLLCTPSNEGALTIQVEKLLFDERVRQDMAVNQYSDTVEKFSLKRMVQETLIEYESKT